LAKWKGDEHWAVWCRQYIELSEVSPYPAQAMARVTGMTATSVAGIVARLREKGFITPFRTGEKPRLTAKTLDILERVRLKVESPIVFDVTVYAKSKAEALAEVWDVITQLEGWDDRNGEPFHYRPNRMKNLGREEV